MKDNKFIKKLVEVIPPKEDDCSEIVKAVLEDVEAAFDELGYGFSTKVEGEYTWVVAQGYSGVSQGVFRFDYSTSQKSVEDRQVYPCIHLYNPRGHSVPPIPEGQCFNQAWVHTREEFEDTLSKWFDASMLSIPPKEDEAPRKSRIEETCKLYGDRLKTYGPIGCDDPSPLLHVRWMVQEIPKFIEEGRIEKANRWLGFAQGVLWEQDIYTIDEMKEHNRETPDD
jgi:hypothetical protein